MNTQEAEVYKLTQPAQATSQGKPFDASESVDKIFSAITKAQPALEKVHTNKKGNFSKYADLGQYLTAIREPLAENGLAIIQTTRDAEESVTLITILAHSSGQWISGEMTLKPEKGGPQGVGSVLTYARRYGIAAICGIAQVDDDAAGATKKDEDTLTEEQIADIWAKADELFGDDADEILAGLAKAIFDVDTYVNIQSKHFDTAIDWLGKKKAKMDKDAAAE